MDPTRLAVASDVLSKAFAAARAAGVTRVAELTRLDRIGLPVWQAVRPLGLALSVHQGKGASDADAKVGALLEAVESHYAEIFSPEGLVCRFDELPGHQRAAMLGDFAHDRSVPPDASADYRWVAAENLYSGGVIHLPFSVVSLDFTRDVPSPFDRSSNGVAAGSSRDEALAVALHEFIERDAVTEWQTRGILACTADVLRLHTVPFDWLHELKARIEAAGAVLRCYRVPSVTATPVFACEINDAGKSGAPYRTTNGRGCHWNPEIALFKAVAEAIQARATFIAGAREDLPPGRYKENTNRIEMAFGLPLPPGLPGVSWNQIEPGPVGAAAIVDRLARCGYPQVAAISLGEPEGFYIMRVFVCGLGSMRRRRRAP